MQTLNFANLTPVQDIPDRENSKYVKKSEMKKKERKRKKLKLEKLQKY
jgi:hypothetical protein